MTPPLAHAGIALSASFLSSLGAQLVGSGLADIQGGTGSSADEASLIGIAYVMGQLAGVVCAAPLIGAFGLSRHLSAGAMLFAAAALACANAADPSHLIVLRGIQGFAAGGFGPAAFVAVMSTMAGGPRFPLGLTLLAAALLIPLSLGPVLAGYLEDGAGWSSLFLFQAAAGAILAALAAALPERMPPKWPALRRDWAAILLLSTALAATILVLSQGTRRYWLDSELVAWSLAISAGAWAGFAVSASCSPIPVINIALLKRRAFVAPLTLNLMFRAGFAGILLLAPQLLAMIQSYRPLESGRLFLWAAIPQAIMLPAACWLLGRIDGRAMIAAGLALFGAGLLLLGGSTNQTAADQLRLPLLLAGTGQALFLVPAILAGFRSIDPQDGPSISFMFNATSILGSNIGIAAAAELVSQRHRFHLGVLAEGAAAAAGKLERLSNVASRLDSVGADEPLAATRALATIGDSLSREAWILSFNEGFLATGLMLVIATFLTLLVDPQQPFGRPLARESGETP